MKKTRSHKRFALFVLGLLLIGVIGGLCWGLLQPERLLRQHMVQVLALQGDQDTSHYWLDAHTLLLVTGKSKTFPNWPVGMPSNWKGKAQRLDIRSGERSPDPGLTQMLNSLHGEPMECTIAPGGQWLLWKVAYTSDHYPNPVVSTLDGKRSYGLAADKFEDKYWINSHQWAHHQSPKETNSDIPMLSHLYIHDVNAPEKEQKLPVNSAQARALIAGTSPDGKQYKMEHQEGSNPPKDWHLAVYDVCDHYFIADPKPLRTLTIRFQPFDIKEVDAFVSPNHRHIAYTLDYKPVFPLQVWLHHFIPQVSVPEQKEMRGLWVSGIDGSDLHEVGHMLSTDQNVMDGFQWLADNEHLSWSDESGVYIVSVE